ncbi:MAG: NOP5/NOP56 family protein [Thermoplasmata archaeon]
MTDGTLLVTTWFGAFLLRDGRVLRALPFPPDALADRLSLRREGRVLPEEEELLRQHPGPVVTRDRRLTALGCRISSVEEPEIDPAAHGFGAGELRPLLLARAQADLSESWDPTIHVQEAVRALTDVDGILNRVGERLAAWAEHDRPPEAGEEGEAHRRLAHRLLEGASAPVFGVPDADPALAAGRRRLAALYLAMEATHQELEDALTEAMPVRTPNLAALLGPLLAARLISQAGSLDRLSRLPASTLQVLGAERAFFEHLRGRAPPPRHGLLFLHPSLHSAPRAQRGKLARALAGKVAIAARLDRAGRPVDPRLALEFGRRREEIRALPKRPAGRPGGRRRSAPPLDGAAEDR